MIETNLSTRPFYNDRGLHLALGLLAVVGIVLVLFNATRIVSLSRRHTELSTRVDAAERRAADLRREAARLQQQLNPQELESVTRAAREANEIIERRTFSWTDLFNRFETTLPPNVRISSVRPKIGQAGDVVVSMTAVGRSVEDIDRFIENLEATRAFANVLSREETVGEDGLIEATLEGAYVPGAATPPAGSVP
jgi:Tfp pilus assembly protein PilN